MAITFNTDWLNKTVNKTARTSTLPYQATVWHETANGSGVAANTLNWNLAKKAGSSYDFLIGRDGTIYQYLDYKHWTSWDTGDSKWTINGVEHIDWQLNAITLGVELDGAADGTPVTKAQIEAAAKLMVFLHQTEGIPLDRAHQLTHAEIAKHRTTNKRTDPRGYTPEQIIKRALELMNPTPVEPDWASRWGTKVHYFADSGIAAAWRKAWSLGNELGPAQTDEFEIIGGGVARAFLNGYITWHERGGTTVRSWV